MRRDAPAPPVPRIQLAHSAMGVLLENFPAAAGSSQLAPASQSVYGSTLGLRAGDSITGIVLRLAVAAAGTAPILARFGLADPTGKILALSADLGAAANWALGPNKFAFTAPYRITADGGYLPCFVVNGTWGTTQPTLLRAAPPTASTTLPLAGAAPPAFVWTGQTDLPALAASLTITNGGLAFWMGLY